MDFDRSGTGRRFQAKDWHVPLPCTGVFGASSPPRKPPNILVSPIADARLLEGDSPAYLDRPRPPTRATPREGWRLFDGQDVWIRS